MKRLRDYFNNRDKLRYLLWRLSKTSEPITVRLKTGVSLTLRPEPTTDLATAYEIFLGQAYHQPDQVPRISPQLIIDIGANVGFSVIYWSAIYPYAQIVAFEPLEIHLRMIRENVAKNKLSDRVKIISHGVSNKEYEAFIVERENESIVVDVAEQGNYHKIKILDLFKEIGNQRIDLLKMDIEGGEYSILNDDRFKQLNIKQIVMEWHNTDEILDGYQWCVNRLFELGFNTIDGEIRYPQAGVIWAWKSDQ